MSDKPVDQKIRVRFAPSPTGDPHVGNIRTALFNYLFAKKEHGAFIVRIEDTDKAREVPGSEDRINESLEWLGIETDESPWQDGLFSPYRQSERLDIYKKHALKLIEKNAAYYCFCIPERLTELRAQQEKNHQPPRYDRHCRALDPEESRARAETEVYVIRLAIPENQQITWDDEIKGQMKFDSDELDDQVLLKSDGFPTYHLAAVVDDHLMEISHVLRGDDWLSSTPKHLLLYAAFEWDAPHFGHFPTILGADKAKLSKRNGDAALLTYKTEVGVHPMAMVHFLSFLGWTPQKVQEMYTYETLSDGFDLKRVGTSPAIFDMSRLNSLSHLYYGAMGEEDYYDHFMGWINDATQDDQAREVITRIVTLNGTEPQYVKAMVGVAQLRTDNLQQAIEFAGQYDADDALTSLRSEDLLLDGKIDAAMAKQALEVVKKGVAQLDDGLNQSTEDRIKHLQDYFRALQPTELSGQAYLHPTRVALTGRRQSMNMFEFMAALLMKSDGKKVIVDRLKTAISLLQ